MSQNVSQSTRSTRADDLATRTTGTTRRVSTETKAAVKTTELIAYVVVTIAVLIAAQVSDDFAAKDAWFFATLLTVGYLVSRGLAKSGSRDFYDDDRGLDHGVRHDGRIDR